ncbi:dolichyl-diphosphooligosaccharide-protein glycotransferase [Schizopora paradoxa]|uniref:Dolichyl-diphosphooligosaccharide-protein glycotransferase n=1 Tax=Schizopora paradoxa TaxID=27342 RepID=A0A0H2RMJ5_9AGAM|nr:dolichyl-diphosphooligosaccharide-protein glycotransferase [Schizopora paradoxa]
MIKQFLWALLLVPFGLAASSSPHERLVQLADASSDGIIQLNDETFDLVTSSKRDWSVVLQLTAMDKKMRCSPCREFEPSFKAVSKAWKSVPKSERDKHFFATLDFADGEKIFRRLQIMAAPVVTFYPATEGPNKLANGKVDPFQYDFSNYGYDAKELATLMSQFTSVPIPYRVPIDWGFVLTFGATVLSCAVAARLILPVLVNKWTWAAITISTMLVMTSGFMFVRIRGMPYRTAEHTMVPGYQNQVGAEIWTVSSKYFILSSSFLVLIIGAPRQSNSNFQRGAVYIAVVIIVMMFSALIKDFKVKNGGYPFTYPF